MTSTLGHALLALLARGPATGYELARHLERPVGFFYAARHSQVYPELAALEEQGLAAHEVVDGAGPRPTKRFRLTAAGEDALRAWLAAPPRSTGPIRDVETLQLYSLWFLPRDDARGLVEAWRRRHAEQLAVLEREEAAVLEPGPPAPDDPRFGNLAAVTTGILDARSKIARCDVLLERLGAPRD